MHQMTNNYKLKYDIWQSLASASYTYKHIVRKLLSETANKYKTAVLLQGNRAMAQLLFSG